jgi:hypothetical protein
VRLVCDSPAVKRRTARSWGVYLTDDDLPEPAHFYPDCPDSEI